MSGGSTDTGRVRVRFPNPGRGTRSEHRVRVSDREARTRVGFPVVEGFATAAEAREYLAEPLIRCLLCGRSFGMLAMHVVSVHGMSAYEYKVRYRLPLSVGLAGTVAREKMRVATATRVRRGELRLASGRPPSARNRPSPYLSMFSAAVGTVAFARWNAAHPGKIWKTHGRCSGCGKATRVRLDNPAPRCWTCRYPPKQKKDR